MKAFEIAGKNHKVKKISVKSQLISKVKQHLPLSKRLRKKIDEIVDLSELDFQVKLLI